MVLVGIQGFMRVKHQTRWKERNLAPQKKRTDYEKTFFLLHHFVTMWD